MLWFTDKVIYFGSMIIIFKRKEILVSIKELKFRI